MCKMITLYHHLTNAEAAEAAAATGTLRTDKPWKTGPCSQLNNPFDTTDHTMSSTFEDTSETFLLEETRLHYVPMVPVNERRQDQKSQPMTTALNPSKAASSLRNSSIAPSRKSKLTKSHRLSEQMASSSAAPLLNFESQHALGSLESKLMKRYKISYKEAVNVTSKAKKASSRRHISVEDICHEMLNGAESDFRTVKLRPVNKQKKQDTPRISEPRSQRLERSAEMPIRQPVSKDCAVKTVAATFATLSSIKSVPAMPASKRTDSLSLHDKSPKHGKSIRLENLSDPKAVEREASIASNDGSCQASTDLGAAVRRQRRHVSFNIEANTSFPLNRVSTVNQLPQSLLMQQFNLNHAKALQLAEKARANVGLPPWIPTSPEILEECKRLATNIIDTERQHQAHLSLPVVQDKEIILQESREVEDKRTSVDLDEEKNSLTTGNEEVMVAEERAEDLKKSSNSLIDKQRSIDEKEDNLAIMTEAGEENKILYFPIESQTLFADKEANLATGKETDGKNTNVNSLFDAYNLIGNERDWDIESPHDLYLKTTIAEDSKTRKSLLSANQMFRPLETILAQRHGITWQAAKQIVQRGRSSLDMAHTLAWSPQLEKVCEENCAAGSGNQNANCENETLSVVYSIDVKDLSESDTEIGKSWVSYSIEECSLVSRCPSRNQDVILVEKGSDSCRSSASTKSMASEAFDIPCLIYIRVDEPPEVPMDEPLDAVLGIPFLRRRMSKRPQRNKLVATNSTTNIFSRVLAKIKTKTTGRLSSNSSECRRRTLVDL